MGQQPTGHLFQTAAAYAVGPGGCARRLVDTDSNCHPAPEAQTQNEYKSNLTRKAMCCIMTCPVMAWSWSQFHELE